MAANASNATSLRVVELEKDLEDQREAFEQVDKQLQNLVNIKQQDEKIMLERFRQLLNSKKLKIRDQQRLLATAKVDEATAKQVRDARENHKPGSKERGKARTSKRKANGGHTAEPLAEDVDDMEVDDVADRDDTPARTDEEITDDEGFDSISTMPAVIRDESASNQVRHAANDQPFDMPAARELPFGQPSHPTSAPAGTVGGGDDDEETDDEL